MTKLRRAAIVSPLRTAVGKFQGALSPLQAGDLGAIVLKALVERTKIDPARIDDSTRFKEDLEADSLDLYELVMELEDSYGITVSREDTAKITTVGDAVDFVLERLPA